MIKSHKPRGHIWTHASTFQQTEEYRNIRYEECLAPPAKSLASDPEDQLSEAQRVAKRRRIERLANDFLNGEPLFISSAEPCPQSLRSTIIWNKKSSDEPKFVLPKVDVANESSVAWDDVEDDAEILARLTKSRSKAKSASDRSTSNLDSETRETVIEVQAQASCRPARRIKTLTVSAGPSEDALRQAAVLRARRVNRSASDVAALPTKQSSRSRLNDEDPSEPRSEPAEGADGRAEHSESGAWLSRRKSRFSFNRFNVDKSESDPGSISSVETQSMTVRRSARIRQLSPRATSKRLISQVASAADVIAFGCPREASSESCSPDLQPISSLLRGSTEDLPAPVSTSERRREPFGEIHTDDDVSQRKASYHTAPERTAMEAEVDAPQDEIVSRDTSQTRPLNRQDIKAVPCRSWTSTNQASSGTRHVPPLKIADDAPTVVTAMSAIRQSLQKSAQLNAGKPTKGKRKKSTAKSTPQQPSTSRETRSAPNTDSQIAVHSDLPVDQQQQRNGCLKAEGKRPTYRIASSAQEGSTPFMYRKLAFEPHNGDARQEIVAIQARKGAWREMIPPSFASNGAAEPQERNAAQSVAVYPPTLDMSFDHDSSFAPKLNMALVEKHLNKVLPTDPESTGRSSVVKKAIRRELRNSGAEITRCDSEPPTSSQVDGPEPGELRFLEQGGSVANASGGLSSFEKQSAPSQFWPGTQFLLNQAQKDLMASPDKAATAVEPAEDCIHHVNDKATTEPTHGAIREPLKQLSQEPLPSTQTMLDGFAGWSTVKKPLRAYPSSPLPTPTADERSLREPAEMPKPLKSSYILSDSVGSAGNDDRRRSSLRFSASSLDSPSFQADKVALPSETTSARELVSFPLSTSLAAPQSTSNTNNARRLRTNRPPDGTATHAAPESPGKYVTSQSITSGPLLSSFQAAQPSSQLLRDDSDLERTIGELTNDLLGTEDVDGVFSQVG